MHVFIYFPLFSRACICILLIISCVCICVYAFQSVSFSPRFLSLSPLIIATYFRYVYSMQNRLSILIYDSRSNWVDSEFFPFLFFVVYFSFSIFIQRNIIRATNTIVQSQSAANSANGFFMHKRSCEPNKRSMQRALYILYTMYAMSIESFRKGYLLNVKFSLYSFSFSLSVSECVDF